MQSVFKTLLALALGLGFLALEARARSSVAFLGIDPETDPLFGRALSLLIHRDLAADSALASRPPGAIHQFLTQAALEPTLAGRADIGLLRRGLEADFYAYGWLEPLTVANRRVWWLPWSVRTEWSRGLRLRVLDGTSGETVFDGLVAAKIPERNFLSGPDATHSGKGTLERDARHRRMLPILSTETAKALSKVVAEKSPKGRDPAPAP